jgi:hypothetical protein
LIMLIIGIGIVVYWFVKDNKRKNWRRGLQNTNRKKQLLNTLEQKGLWQKGEVKAYYSELTDIAELYWRGNRYPAMESTTSELITGLRAASVRKKTVSQDTIANLERVLKQADLVKFAKSKPLDFEITEDRNKIQRQFSHWIVPFR